MVFERHGQDLQQEVIFFLVVFVVDEILDFFLWKASILEYYNHQESAKPLQVTVVVPWGQGERAQRSFDIFRQPVSLVAASQHSKPRRCRPKRSLRRVRGTKGGRHGVSIILKHIANIKILEVTYLSTRKEGIWNLSIPNDPYKALKRMVCKLLLNEDPQHITELFATAIHRHRPPDDLGTRCWGSSACWLDDLLALRLMMVIVTLICRQTRAFNCPYTTAKSRQFGGNSANSNCLLWLMWLHKWNPVKVRCVDLSLADFPFFRLFQGTFPHEVSATSEKFQGFPWFGSQMFFDTSELHGFDTHKYLQPIDESMYTHHMRIEHGESKCSQNERHIWNLNKSFFFGFGHSETWVHQTFTSLCCFNDRPWTLDFPHGFPRGPTRRDVAQALAFGEVMQVDRGRWRLKLKTAGKLWWLMHMDLFVCLLKLQGVKIVWEDGIKMGW